MMKSVKPLEIFQTVVKNCSAKQGRLLGLDVGHKFVGLSVSDTCNKIASPVSVLVRKKTNIDTMAKDFQTLDGRIAPFCGYAGLKLQFTPNEAPFGAPSLIIDIPISRFSLVGFVVGYPFCLHGQHSLEAVQVRLFMGELCKTGKLDDMRFTYWDENFTSKCAEALLHPLNVHPVEYKTIIDKFAAVGILQGYLDHMNWTFRAGQPKELSTRR